MPICMCFGRCWGLDEKLATQTLKGLSFWISAIPFFIWHFRVANVDSLARRDTIPVACDDTSTIFRCLAGMVNCVATRIGTFSISSTNLRSGFGVWMELTFCDDRAIIGTERLEWGAIVRFTGLIVWIFSLMKAAPTIIPGGRSVSRLK